MSNKYFDGIVTDKKVTEAVDDDLKSVVTTTLDKVIAKMADLRVADALTEIFVLFKRCNKYIDETEPWVLAKDEAKKDRLATVLYNLIESITIGTGLLEPFMPKTAANISAQLNIPVRSFEQAKTFGLYPDNTKVTETPEILFARLDVKEITEKAEAMFAARKAETENKLLEAEAAGETADTGTKTEAASSREIEVEKKPEIEYNDFGKLQFQVGEIISCEEVKKSKKLLCSQVRIGSEIKQIVSGIKHYYSAEEMVGKKVMVLVNLKPATLAGVVSEGMLLCAEDAEGNLALMVPEKTMPAGAEIC
jgi:methionyl-tRNA synthetase